MWNKNGIYLKVVEICNVLALVISSKIVKKNIFQAYFLVADDIMDGSVTRRGQPCWYKKDNIGMMAVNDALILESCIYELLEKHLAGDPFYHQAIDAFLKVGTPWI